MIYTYTNLNCYNSICPHQFYHRYVAKDIPFTETPAMKHGNNVHTAFEQRLTGSKPLPDFLRHHEPMVEPLTKRQVAVELKLGMTADGKGIDFWDRDAFLRGKLDCVVLNGARAYMLDWKTGKLREEPFELEVGALLLQASYPGIEVIVGNYVWLAENRIGKLHDLTDTKKTMVKVRDIARRIESDRTWEKRPSGLCGFCNVLDCEHNRSPR